MLQTRSTLLWLIFMTYFVKIKRPVAVFSRTFTISNSFAKRKEIYKLVYKIFGPQTYTKEKQNYTKTYKELKPTLNKQCESIRAKLFV